MGYLLFLVLEEATIISSVGGATAALSQMLVVSNQIAGAEAFANSRGRK